MNSGYNATNRSYRLEFERVLLDVNTSYFSFLSTLLDDMLDTSHVRAEASSRRWKLSLISGELYEAKGVVVRASGENIVA